MNIVLRRFGPAAILVLLSVSGPAAAQERAAPPGADPARERSETTAALYEYVLPVLGHAYAGDWRRGVPPALVTVGGAVFAMSGARECVWEENCGMLALGFGIALGGRVWGIASAVQTARAYNRSLAPQPRITWSLDPQSLRMGLRVPL